MKIKYLFLAALVFSGFSAAASKSAKVAPAQEKKCPFCAEEIKAEAIKCKHCGSELPLLNAGRIAA